MSSARNCLMDLRGVCELRVLSSLVVFEGVINLLSLKGNEG